MNRLRWLLVVSVLLVVPLSAQELDSLLIEVMKPHYDQLPGMIKRRQIRVLVHWSKTDYFIEKGQQHGLIYELARDFERFVNKELNTGKTPLSCVIVPVSRDKLVSYLEEGLGEISFVGMHETPELRGRVTFSASFYNNASEIVMRHNKASPIRSVEDLSGKTFHLRPTSKYVSTLKQLNQALHDRGLPEAHILPLSEHLADADIMEMMDAGLFDYTILDDYRGDFWVSIFPNVVAEHQYELIDHVPLRFLLRNGTPKLKVLLDKFIASHKIGTTYGNVLAKRYYGTNPWARRALGATERKRFHDMVEIFRRYGDKYGFDYLMLTAQGFQESGLNQDSRSKVGAVGVMQVMPATGNAMKVGNIQKVEPNIHAGVKYMNQLATQYFADPEINATNRTLFCFAAYNAGPGRISKFRKQAQARKLNSNIWFDNVERIVAEKGNRETVQYVMNISKYYMAYKMLEEQTLKRDEAKRKIWRENN